MHFEPRRRVRLLTLIAAQGALWLAPAIQNVVAQPAAGPSGVRVDQAWIRWLPAGVPGGAYLTLSNSSERAVVIVGASSPTYGDVMLHRTVHRGGNVEMVPAERIIIAAHATLDFAATGYHFMLMDPVKPVKPGDTVPITLHFADGTSLAIPFEVRR